MLGAVVLSLARLAKPRTNLRRLWQVYNDDNDDDESSDEMAGSEMKMIAIKGG
jgi:hypothetical protein